MSLAAAVLVWGLFMLAAGSGSCLHAGLYDSCTLVAKVSVKSGKWQLL